LNSGNGGSHKLRKDSSAKEVQALTWNLQGECRRGTQRRRWKKKVEEEAEIVARTLERGEGNNSEQRPMELLCGGSMLSSERNLT
jgi:hypothetical protein